MATQIGKRAQIDKANVVMVFIVAIAAFITVFSLVSAKALWTRQAYQNRVIEKREQARDQLDKNIKAVGQLAASYKEFTSLPENVIGGNPTGTGERDGDNARVVLDALPSKYDFPALASSLEKVVASKNIKIESITGTDDELAQSQTGLSNLPQAIEMPFTLTVSGNYAGLTDLIGTFEKSIRPFKMTKLMFTGGQNSEINLIIDAKSYYQPEKNLEFKKEVVK